MIALLAVSLSILFVNMVPDTEAMSVKAKFDLMSQCQQVKTDEQVCVLKGDTGAYLYSPR